MSGEIRILIVDDEEPFVRSLSKVLRFRGMTVKGVYEGASAVEALSREPFDVVLLDMRMPDMDGLQTLQAMRDKKLLTPVIVLTGHEDVEKVRMVLQKGVVEFLLKPCDIDELVAAIENAGERNALASEAMPPPRG